MKCEGRYRVADTLKDDPIAGKPKSAGAPATDALPAVFAVEMLTADDAAAMIVTLVAAPTTERVGLDGDWLPELALTSWVPTIVPQPLTVAVFKG